MSNKAQILTIIFGLSLVFITSCNRDSEGCTDSLATNYDANADDDDGSCEYDIITPDEYVYEDADGNSTVSYSGQHIRLNMLSEMVTVMKSANTEGTVVDGNTLISMYGHDGYTWDDVENLDMNSPDNTKQLRNKTAGGDPTIIAQFETWMTELGDASTLTSSQTGSAGVAGVVVSTSNPSKQYLQNAEGQEWTQLIEKGLMGACFYYNISSVYLAPAKMDVDNSEAVDPANGKYYTTMEHHWDEAYGYFTTAPDYPVNGTDRFWGKYADGREDPLGSATKIVEAFRLGRAAISADIMAVRDQQITLINQEMEKMAGGTAIHYLNAAIDSFGDDALRNHTLSEAKAFIMALPYGAETSVNFNKSEEILDLLGEDYYNVTTANILAARDELATILGLTQYADEL